MNANGVRNRRGTNDIMTLFSSPILPIDQLEIALVSDIHIASGDRNDYEYKNEYPISGEAKTLEKLCRTIQLASCSAGYYIVILGDTINGECGYWSSMKTTAFKHLMAAMRPWFESRRGFIILGNHDIQLKQYIGAYRLPNGAPIPTECIIPNTSYLNIGGTIMLHGNQFDWRCTGKRGTAGMLGDIASLAVTTLLPPALEDVLRGREFEYTRGELNKTRNVSMATLAEMNSENYAVANGALKFLKDLQTDNPNVHTVICGHTHQKPVQISAPHGRYINAGKFSKDGIVNVRASVANNTYDRIVTFGSPMAGGSFVEYNKWRPTLTN